MIFLGFIAFLDPAKDSVTETLKSLEQYGIEIKVLTGDNELVSQKVAKDIELPVKGVIMGADLERMTDDELSLRSEATTIFARVSPDQKKRIIKILQGNKHVVGFLGDGINDAPSLKTADVGISVNNAVDVAKESADLILLKKSLGDLIEGVLDGRKTFANTLKYLMMELSSNFGNMFSMAGASVFLPFLPMLPTQILFNNLMYGASQFAIPLDNVDQESIKKPIKFNIDFIKKFMLLFGPVSSIFDFITFFVLFAIFHFPEHSFQTGWFLESLTTQSLVIFLIRTKKIPFLQSVPSASLVLSMALSVLIGWSVTFMPLGKLFNFVPLPPVTLLIISIIVGLYLGLIEVSKQWFYSRIKNSML
jgi:Mg2+-importing ATPase